MGEIEARDGHKVESNYEKRVDDALSKANITHTLHPNIPQSQYKADFKVGNVYVEVWGGEGSKDYDKQKEEKIEHYNNIGKYQDLVEISSEDCKSASSLNQKIKEIKEKKTTDQKELSEEEKENDITVPLEGFDIAEIIAKDKNGEEIESKEEAIEDLTEEKERYRAKIKEINRKIEEKKNKKQKIIGKHL
ncbi:MAG: hypothetical protein ACOC5D_02795 [Thermoplasmatota archaeon]